MNKKIDLPENAKQCIIEYAAKYGIARVVLFGSRARGDNRPQSDIDIAVAGGDTDGFASAVKDTTKTLLTFDIVQLDKLKNSELKDIISEEGVLIYEKA